VIAWKDIPITIRTNRERRGGREVDLNESIHRFIRNLRGNCRGKSGGRSREEGRADCCGGSNK
jgi:hypothetical protein